MRSRVSGPSDSSRGPQIAVKARVWLLAVLDAAAVGILHRHAAVLAARYAKAAVSVVQARSGMSHSNRYQPQRQRRRVADILVVASINIPNVRPMRQRKCTPLFIPFRSGKLEV
jgi:hypothetical protein